MSAPSPADGSVACRIESLHVHPVKSCAGVSVDAAVLTPTGLDLDRLWMVVDADGRMLTQREEPRLALVVPSLKHDEIVLRAPGMLALHLRADTVEDPSRPLAGEVWGDAVRGFDMGALAGQWFADFLGRRGLRVWRFDPDFRRPTDPAWSGGVDGEAAFADGFPLLVAGRASLDELNRRLAARGAAAVGIERFRPNLVLSGLEPFDEDHVGAIEVDTPEGPVRLKLTKPCVRCTIPDVDPATGTAGHAVGDELATFRADARMGGGVTFGMNAVVEHGVDLTLARGQAVRAVYAF